MASRKPRRSQQWFGRDGKMGFIYRSWVKNRGIPHDQFDGRPVIGICNTYSELTPCNSHFRTLAEHVKAGVISLTKSLGKELAKTGIRVNCVTPAAVKTGMFSQMTQSHIDFMLSKIPMGRFGEVEEIAALVSWLCTEDCSFSTGAVFDLSGGRAVY